MVRIVKQNIRNRMARKKVQLHCKSERSKKSKEFEEELKARKKAFKDAKTDFIK
jgi:hypothetical protein